MAIMMVFCLTGISNAYTLDFDDTSGDIDNYQGFVFTGSSTVGGGVLYTNDGFYMERSDGGLFDLTQFSYILSGFDDMYLNITTSAEGYILISYNITGDDDILMTSYLEFYDIDRVSFTPYNTILTGIDNIEYDINTVPVPGALYLLSSGIIGLLVFNRKK